jgi:hypothetical protein
LGGERRSGATPVLGYKRVDVLEHRVARPRRELLDLLELAEKLPVLR